MPAGRSVPLPHLALIRSIAAILAADRVMSRVGIRVSSVPEYPKGKGVVLQKYGQESMKAINMIAIANGLTYRDKKNGEIRSIKDLTKWTQNRGTKGCAAPPGSPEATDLIA